MNKSELQEILTNKKVPVSSYSLDGKLYPDRFELRLCNNEWMVYYCDERGNKHDLKIFDSEEKACSYFYDFVRNNSYMAKFFND